MARVPDEMKLADSRRVGGCQKPNCNLPGIPQRHHMKHEAIWFGVWAWRGNEKKWHKFKQRYYKFLPVDTVILCPNHHAEIHAAYDSIINEERALAGKTLANFTWPEAKSLMNKLKTYCLMWLKHPSPGIDTETFKKERYVTSPKPVHWSRMPTPIPRRRDDKGRFVSSGASKGRVGKKRK